VVSVAVTGEIDVVEPANRLPLRNVVSYDYRLYLISTSWRTRSAPP
jgi:hypothetical protein